MPNLRGFSLPSELWDEGHEDQSDGEADLPEDRDDQGEHDGGVGQDRGARVRLPRHAPQSSQVVYVLNTWISTLNCCTYRM